MGLFCCFYLDYIFALVSIATLVVSTLLNPLVLYYRISNFSHSLPSILFLVLSITDLTMGLLLPIYITYHLLKPTREPLLRPATPGDVLHFLMFRVLAGGSAILTGLIAVCRWLQVRRPMMGLGRKVVVGYTVSVWLGTQLGGNLYGVLKCGLDGANWTNNYQTVVTNGCGVPSLMAHWVVIGHAWAGLTASLVTVVQLRRVAHPATVRSTRHGIGTILAMNTLLSLHTVVTIVMFLVNRPTLDWDHGLVEGYHDNSATLNAALYYFLPVAFAAWNPVLVLAGNKRIREFLVRSVNTPHHVPPCSLV
eukprot:sb/3467177/